MLNELISPAYGSPDGAENFFHGLRDGGVISGSLSAGLSRETGIGQEQVCFCTLGRAQRTYPQPGPEIARTNLFSQPRHTGKTGCVLPSVIDDDEGTMARGRRERRYQIRVAKDALLGVFAVGIVPVVAATQGTARQPRLRAHCTAEAPGCGRGWLLGLASICNYRSNVESALSQLHRVAAIAYIEPERHALGIRLPETEGGGTGLDAIAVEFFAVEGEKIPRHNAVGNKPAPLQVAIAALPLVAEKPKIAGNAETPAQMQMRQVRARSKEVNLQIRLGVIWPGGCPDGDIPLTPFFPIPKERYGVIASGEGDDCIRGAQYLQIGGGGVFRRGSRFRGERIRRKNAAPRRRSHSDKSSSRKSRSHVSLSLSQPGLLTRISSPPILSSRPEAAQRATVVEVSAAGSETASLPT